MKLQTLVLAAMALCATCQTPNSTWTPNQYDLFGVYCDSHAKNPNAPDLHAHIGGCGCENTMFRIGATASSPGKMYVMESTGHDCEDVFPGYNATKLGDCSYFRIRDMESGLVIANVSESINHDFCSSVVDYDHNKVWTFCSAFGRDAPQPGPCAVGEGCYIGAWWASLDDLTTWSPLAKAVQIPDGIKVFNNDVTLVKTSVPGLPKHQAAMVLESHDVTFAINVGSDGDLSKNWQVLNHTQYSIKDGGAAGEGTGDAPALKFDNKEGWFYSFGGGWITNGPARSRTLETDSWEVSPLAPIAIPAGIAAQQGIPHHVHYNTTTWFKDVWAAQGGITPYNEAFLANITAWNWGVTDPDMCCDDGVGPSWMLHTLSRQGAPRNVTGNYAVQAALLKSPLEQYAWLRSFFP